MFTYTVEKNIDRNIILTLFFVVFLQEYGINKVEKLDIAYGYCLPLVRKIQMDLQRTHEDESVNKLHPL